MRSFKLTILAIVLLLADSCITKFIPESSESQDMMIVQGVITDQPGPNTITLSKSQSLSYTSSSYPYSDCIVTVTDDLGNTWPLTQKTAGVYVTDSASFVGVVGRKYQLKIRTNNSNGINYTYESVPVTMLPVPPIDSLYYEKITIGDGSGSESQGAQIYFDTHDPDNKCLYYRWDYNETWKFQLPYSVTNSICWISNSSSAINIKNVNLLTENRISKYMIDYVSPETDRLSMRYCFQLNQYSINEDEYEYWNKIENVAQQVGSLYDITPTSIPGNMSCIEDPGQTVLGYFSVSAKSSRRLYISDYFTGLVNLYTNCPSDTVNSLKNVQGLNRTVWVIESVTFVVPPIYILTRTKGCADCTVRGTTVKPWWWENTK